MNDQEKIDYARRILELERDHQAWGDVLAGVSLNLNHPLDHYQLRKLGFELLGVPPEEIEEDEINDLFDEMVVRRSNLPGFIEEVRRKFVSV